MMSLVVVGLVAFLAWNWVRLTRLRRQQWLARLQLPGMGGRRGGGGEPVAAG